jgi:hypothetical protein
MRDELYESLWRYEAMTGLIDWQNEADPGQQERDRTAYDKDYGLVLYPDGQHYTSYARMLRFLVEVCGHAYEESLEAIVGYSQGMPCAYRASANPEDDARQIRSSGENIIEALFDLKVGRLIAGGNDVVLNFNWQTTRCLMAMEAPSRLPG